MTTQRFYEKVANFMADQICSGTYQKGERMPSERLLAEYHGVSRPTIREAVIALEIGGLVEVHTSSGVYVNSSWR